MRSNLAWRTVITPSTRSTSARVSAIASPLRMPVAATSPSSAVWVAARNGGRSRRAAASTSAISPGV